MKPFRFLFCRGCFIPPLASTLGCELAATVDRSQIGNGGEGGMGGMGGMGGTGGISCDPAACPAASNECVDVVCNADGTCGESPKADGPATTQVAGDCKQSLCKAGQVVDDTDDADIAIDGNECTDDVCTAGVPSNPLLPADSPCGPNGLSFCDGSGTCGECTTPTQCPGTDTECQTRTCDMGVCGVSHIIQGTPVAAQTMGDCLQDVCDGTGGIEAIADDVDVGDDGNDCTDDACNNGMAVTTNVAVNAACGAGGALYCDGNGGCVTCTDASQCGTPANACLVATCTAGMCGTADKANGTSCDDNNPCSQTDTCQAGACTGGNAVICSALDQCHDAGTCNPANGVCNDLIKMDGASCSDANGCTQADTCQAGACAAGSPVTCMALDQCHDAGTCNPANGICDDPPKTNGTSCTDGNACTQADTCQAGACLAGSPVTCTALDQCHDVGTCNAGTGVCDDPIKANGTPCTLGGGFGSGACAAGACAAAIDYIKASNTGAGDNFGYSVAFSADGNTLAVGAYSEDGNATGVGGDETNNSASAAGAVYVFTRSGGVWSQQAYIKASNTGTTDTFGRIVALSADGNTLAVGSSGEDSDATGIDGNQGNGTTGNGSGAAYVFTRSGGVWTQQAYVKASNTGQNDSFGYHLALSADGDTLAVGAYAEDSNATGIDGIQTNNSAGDSGAVYVFTRSGGVWSQQAYIKSSNTSTSDNFGLNVALSGDGNVLAVGASAEDSNATGIDGDQADNSASGAGAVYMFTRGGGVWAQQAYVKASNTGAGDAFGIAVALSAMGDTLVIGANREASNATGIDGNQADDSFVQAGAVYVFTQSGGAWTQQAYVKASNTGASDRFGNSVALSATGDTLAVGALQEGSNATGVNGNQADNSATAGAVYLLTRMGGVWSQVAYVKASNTGTSDKFGGAVALSADGTKLAVGAIDEDSNATGINGNQSDNSASNAGAVYVY